MEQYLALKPLILKTLGGAIGLNLLRQTISTCMQCMVMIFLHIFVYRKRPPGSEPARPRWLLDLARRHPTRTLPRVTPCHG